MPHMPKDKMNAKGKPIPKKPAKMNIKKAKNSIKSKTNKGNR